MKLRPVYFLLFILFLSCTKDKTILESDRNIDHNIINFRNLLHGRNFFYNVEKSRFVILKSSLELQAFLDTTKSHFHFPQFNSFEDSMIIGIILSKDYSFSSSFSIDSIIAASNETIVFSHVFHPVSQLSNKSSLCHFVITQKSNKTTKMDSIKHTYEPLTGEIISFNDFYKGSDVFITKYDAPNKLIVLKNKQDETSFLDTTKYHYLPHFSYQDSMLVGVITPKRFSSSIGWELVSLIKEKDSLFVNFQLFHPRGGSYSDLVSKHHFVAIKKIDAIYKLNDVLFLGPTIE